MSDTATAETAEVTTTPQAVPAIQLCNVCETEDAVFVITPLRAKGVAACYDHRDIVERILTVALPDRELRMSRIRSR